MNSDDATCPHLRILGVTSLSSWVAGAGQYCLDLSLVTFVVTVGDGSVVEWGCDTRGKRTDPKRWWDESPHRCMVGLVAVGTLLGFDGSEPTASGPEPLSP